MQAVTHLPVALPERGDEQRSELSAAQARERRAGPKSTGKLPSVFTSRSTIAERTCVTPACSNKVVCRNFS
jgi:hypothetical protein